MDTKDSNPSLPSPGQDAPQPKRVDWESIKLAYGTTLQSVRDIARAHGVTHAAISKRARKEGWERPSKDQISKPSPRKGAAELEPRQERFVQEYLIDLNGTQAYMRAEPGTTEKSARTLASRMLAKVNVQKRIAAERSKTAAKLELSRERVLAEYAKLAFFDMRQAYHQSGALKMPHELDDDAAAAIASYETVEMSAGDPEAQPMQVRKVKWADKRAALDSIMKAQGWNKSDVGTADNPLVIRDMTDAERAVRISAALQAHPGLAALFAQFVSGGPRK